MDTDKDRIPTDKEMAAIAEAIGQNWEILGMRLGLSSQKIEHIKMDFHTSVTRIQKMLYHWKQMNGENATFSNLYKGIEESKSVSIDWDAIAGIPSRNPQTFRSRSINEEYIQLKQQLKRDLIEFYRDQLGTTPISPVNEIYDAPLMELYVSPTIKKVDQKFGSRSGQEPMKQAATLHEIFKEHSKRYQQIYVTAEAGLGKTVFAKRLALIWCQANDQACDYNADELSFSENDLCAMREFEFVFFVSLKDLDPSDCKIDDMIQNQVINYLARASLYSTKFIEEILSQEICLIILDGLDEWSHPSESSCKMRISERKSNIPHKRPRSTCTFLTTTRPWKLIFASLSNTKIDQQFEIVGLDESASEELKSKVAEKLKANPDDGIASCHQKADGNDMEGNISDLERKIEGIKKNPMLIMYLACLQNEGRSLGSSMCELYSNILEMMLKRADTNSDVRSSFEENFPGCFNENELCQEYYSILKELGHVAYDTLFKLNGGSGLVFSNLLVTNYMSDAHFNLWIRAGILTHTGFTKQLTGRKLQVSFVHKTFHDFFAALYMSTETVEHYLEDVLKRCGHVSHILEMKNTFMFLSGFCSDQTNVVMRKIVQVVADDSLALRFRHQVYPFLDYWETCELMEEFQNMVVDCVSESNHNHQSTDYYIEDLILNSKNKEGYTSALKQVLGQVKLIKVGRHLSTEESHALLKDLDLLNPEKLRCLVKLDMWGSPKIEDIDAILKGSAESLKCLLLHGCKMVLDKEIEAYIQFSDSTMQLLQGIECLEGIDLFSIEMKHQQIEEFVDWIEKRKNMTEIKLSRIKCTDHGHYTKGGLKDYIKCKFRNRPFDLSEHENLKTVGLGTMRMPVVKLNAATLEECWMERNESIIMHVLQTIVPSTAKLHTLVIEFVEDQDVVENIVNIIPQLCNLRHLQLKGMDLKERDLLLSQRNTFRHLRLIEINMTIVAFEGLIAFFKTCSNSITTELAFCNFVPVKEQTFDKLRKEIEKSGVFDVLFNMKCSGHGNSFAFKTLM